MRSTSCCVDQWPRRFRLSRCVWHRGSGNPCFALAEALKPGERFERFEEVPGDGGVVAKVHLPPLRGHDHEADADGLVRVQLLGAVFHQTPRLSALKVGGEMEHAGLDTTRAEAAPVRLREAEHECVLDAVVGLQRVAEAAENFLVFLPVLIGEHDERGGGESMLETVQAAALFAGVRFGTAFAAIAPVGFTPAF